MCLMSVEKHMVLLLMFSHAVICRNGLVIRKSLDFDGFGVSFDTCLRPTAWIEKIRSSLGRGLNSKVFRKTLF